VLVLLLALPVAARPHKSEAWARSQFATAERLRQGLEARPAQELTRTDYDRVLNAYRRVYFEAPTSTKADPSVVAVAQLLEEKGRHFEDRAILRSAIQEYEFLRRQYPGSKARFGALFRIGEIYKDDLHDKHHADQAFQEFLHLYPRNQFAAEAHKALIEPAEKVTAASDSKAETTGQTRSSDEHGRGSEEDGKNAIPAEKTAEKAVAVGSESRKLARVTGIRHWSTADSTHVAIDLQGAVRYDSQRLAHPERIFFDLFDTELDSILAGKSLAVDETRLKKIRISQFKPRQTRVVLEVGEVSDFQASLLSNPPRLVIDLRDEQVAKADRTEPKATSALNGDIPPTPGKVAVPGAAKAAENEAVDLPTSALRAPQVVISNGVKKTIVDADDHGADTPKPILAKLDATDVRPVSQPASEPVRIGPAKDTKTRGKRKASVATDGREAQPTASGDRSLIRALGLKIGKIVIDPGHGGHDTGTIGPNGLEEKDLVLDVSKRLGKLLASRLGAQVVYTRSDDTFIPLETRTAIANDEAADLFVSVHANSSRDPAARGVETYYLNFTSSPEALEVAARENAVSEESIHELQDLVKKIALKEKIGESREFAVDVERSLHSGLAGKNSGGRDRGVKKAPFIVLIGANMPSILAEISFLSNPGDERRLKTNDYRQKIAESLYRGIAKYVNGLSGVKVASKIEKNNTE
jgi:N-acetylmuramoyl-L-alanine amidase